MKINDKDIKAYFHGDVCRFNDTTMEIENETFLPYGSYLPIIQSTSIKPQVKELVIDFINAEDMSDFAAEIVTPCVIDMEDGYFYECVLTGKQETQDGIQAYSATYTFQVMKRKAMVVETQENFFVEGNCVCGCIYEIKALEEMRDVIVDAIVLHDMKKDQTIIVDGIHKLIYDVTTPDVSAFDQSELTSFPKLKPGSHQVVKNNEHIVMVIKYYPVFM